jgi:hypothetical protein
VNRLLNYLPPYEQESKVFQEIMNAMEDEFDELFLNIEDLDKQLNPDTATWGLAILEKELGLPVNPDLDTHTRRSFIKSKLLMQPPGSKDKFTAILRSFAESTEIEELFGEYRFRVLLSISDRIGKNMSHIYNILETSKPAHLDYETELRVKQRDGEVLFRSLTVLGESVTLYPFIKTSLTGELSVKTANAMQLSDTVTMYPQIKTKLEGEARSYSASTISSSDSTALYPHISSSIEVQSNIRTAMSKNETETITIYPKE